MHIVQEITSRLALRKKEERCLTPDIATRLQEKLQQSGWDHVPRPTRATVPGPSIPPLSVNVNMRFCWPDIGPKEH